MLLWCARDIFNLITHIVPALPKSTAYPFVWNLLRFEPLCDNTFEQDVSVQNYGKSLDTKALLLG